MEMVQEYEYDYENGLEYDKQECPECGAELTVNTPERGETCCGLCGLVLEEKEKWSLERGSKPQIYKNFYGEKQSPSESPIYRGSIIGSNKDAKGNKLSPKNIFDFRRLRKIQNHPSSTEATIYKVIPIFKRISSFVETPKKTVRKNAEKIFIKAIKEKLTMGRNYELIIATSLYFAFDQNNQTKSINAISGAIPGVSSGEIYKCAELFGERLHIKLKNIKTPENYILNFCIKLKAGKETRDKALKIVKSLRKNNMYFSGKDPKGIAASAIYIGAEKKYTQKEIVKIAGVTEVTLRNRIKDIMKFATI